MINLNCALRIKPLYNQKNLRKIGYPNYYANRHSSLAPLKADTVSFRGVTKKCNDKDYKEIEEKILKLNELAQNKDIISHSEISNYLNEKKLKVKPIEEMAKIGANPDSCYGYTTEDITANIEYGENKERFITSFENDCCDMYVPEIKGKDKKATLSTIAHECTHVKQIQKNPNLMAEIIRKKLEEKGLNTQEIIITFINEVQYAVSEISGEMGDNILRNLLKSRCEETRKDVTPLLHNMESALNISLGAKNTNELNECAKYYMKEVVKIVSNEIKNKHSGEFNKKFTREEEVNKYIQNLVKKAIIVNLKKEFEAYTNQGKIIKKLHGISEDSLIATDVLAQAHKLLIDNCD